MTHVWQMLAQLARLVLEHAERRLERDVPTPVVEQVKRQWGR
jgi:hypothetical protein